MARGLNYKKLRKDVNNIWFKRYIMSDIEIFEKMMNMLCEHYECVQIVACRVEKDGSTSTMQLGSGNYFARIKMCEDFAKAHDAGITVSAFTKGFKDAE